MYPTPPAMTGTPSEDTKHVQKLILGYRAMQPAMTFPDIAKVLGYTQGYVHKLYRKALNDIIVDDVKLVRKIEIERLDRMFEKVLKVVESFHPYVSGGHVVRDIVENELGEVVKNENGELVTIRLRDQSYVLNGVDRLLKIMERRARLLGLDKPVKVAQTNPNGNKEASFMQFYLPQNDRDETVPEEALSEESQPETGE
jgi:hypothetical protein